MRKFLFLLVSFTLVIFLAACGEDEPKEKADKSKSEQVEKENKSEELKKETTEPEEQDEKNSGEEDEIDTSWDDLKELDKIVGKSDKVFSDATNSEPSKVRNDKTDNWRITKISENIDIEDYALSYSKEHMKEDEVHFIVNFNRNTTTWLSEMNGLLYVDIREYVDKEEHDAADLGSGMVLKSYVIFPDGDIQELED